MTECFASRLRVVCLVSLAAVSAGCARAHADEPQPLEGVVEFEERTLGFELAGRVRALHVKRGDVVESGQALAELGDDLERPQREAEAAQVIVVRKDLELVRAGARDEDIKSAEGELSSARAQESLAEQGLARERLLVESGSEPKAHLEQAEADYGRALGQRKAVEQRVRALRNGARPQEVAAAVARLEAGQAGVAAMDARLAAHSLRAPIRGTVLELYAEEGEVIQPGMPVLTVADTAAPHVDVFVPEPRMASVHVGGALGIRIDGTSHLYSGIVDQIGRNVEFTPRFLFSERERPNLVMRVRVRITDADLSIHAGVPAFVTLKLGQ